MTGSFFFEKQPVYIRRRNNMRKFKKAAAVAAVAAVTVSMALSGCSKKNAEETSEATATELESEPETLSEDAEAIANIDPVKPESMGEVKLADLSTIEITAPTADAIEEDAVNDMITYYLTMGGETKEVEDAAADSDTVNIDFVGKVDGEEFDGGSADGYDLVLGSGRFIDGFEDGLIGHKAGEEVTLELTFPESYQEATLAGKPVTFDVKINKVSRPLSYEDLTDELADKYSGGKYITANLYREAVRDSLEKQEQAYVKNELITNAVNAVAEASEVETNDAAIGWAIDVYVQNQDKMFKAYATNYGLQGMNGLADYLSSSGQSYADYRSSLEADAKVLAEQTAVVDAIAKEQGFEYNDDTLKQYLADFGYSDQEEQVKASNTEAALQQTVVQYLVGSYLAENIKVNYVTEDEYTEMKQAEAAAAESVEADETETESESESESAAN